jgi:D-alanyl-D-alanine carboxypeptidase/D-alanyl-D-alanine-endopeptidase (penicillin-binding protein 4)
LVTRYRGRMAQPSTPHPRRALWTKTVAALLGGVVVLAGCFGAGYALAGVDAGFPGAALPAEIEPTASSRSTPAIVPVALRLPTCSVVDSAGDPGLGTFSGAVLDPITNEVIFSRDSDGLVAPASVMKLVTAAAALSVLGPERRFGTTVVATDDPEKVVLVGGGDSTLSQLPEGQESVYVGAAKLQELAEKTVAAVAAGLAEGEKVVITEVIVDASLWPESDEWDESWSRDASRNGFISRVSALQVDGDRQNPGVELSPRTDRPAQRAGEAFVAALRAAGNAGRFVRVSSGQAAPASTVLASVDSPPVSELVRYMVKESDNTLAEMLARHVSLESGQLGTTASLSDSIPAAVAGLGLPIEEITVRDGSGLSNLNRVTPRYVALLLAEVLRSQGPLESLRTSLPIAGVDGSLDNRFLGANASLHEQVLAKTGSISGVRSLAGYILSADQTELVFAFFSVGEVGDTTRDFLENLVRAVHACGGNLGDF